MIFATLTVAGIPSADATPAQGSVSLTIRLHFDRPVRVRSAQFAADAESAGIGRAVARCADGTRSNLRAVRSAREADDAARQLREGRFSACARRPDVAHLEILVKQKAIGDLYGAPRRPYARR